MAQSRLREITLGRVNRKLEMEMHLLSDHVAFEFQPSRFVNRGGKPVDVLARVHLLCPRCQRRHEDEPEHGATGSCAGCGLRWKVDGTTLWIWDKDGT